MEKDDHISHTDALKITLDSFYPKSFYGEEDIENYISAFSFYLSLGDDAYHYHPDFLIWKHSNFKGFLQRARNKQSQLKEFVKRLKQCEKIKQWRLSNPQRAKKVRISIDNLFQSELSGEISFCDEVSIEGAEWGKNIITVHFHERTVSFFCPAPDQDMERTVDIFLSLVTDERERGREQ